MSSRVTVRYADAFGLMRDLRAMGLANALFERRRAPLRRATLLRAAQIYAERFGDADGRVRATFELVWLSGWAPHESQQKPLRPGSAQTRLADALGSVPSTASARRRVIRLDRIHLEPAATMHGRIASRVARMNVGRPRTRHHEPAAKRARGFLELIELGLRLPCCGYRDPRTSRGKVYAMRKSSGFIDVI